jgi:hypothetical protein
MSESEKANYKTQSKANRDEYDLEKHKFDELKHISATKNDSIIQSIKARTKEKE